MQVLRTRNRLLIGYLFIAFIFVQSISGFLHAHWHNAAQEPDVAHHHYPVSSTFNNDAHNLFDNSEGLVELDLQSDGLFGGKVSSPVFAVLLLILLLPPIVRSATSLRFSAAIIPSNQQLHYRTPPLRAPPR